MGKRKWLIGPYYTREEAIKEAKKPSRILPSEWDMASWYFERSSYHTNQILKLAMANPHGVMDITDKDVEYLAPLDPPTNRTE